MYRAQRFKELGVDAVFVEALPDKEAMKKCLKSVDIPMMANRRFRSLTFPHNCSSVID
jgi:methylisocitrate lyase